MREYLEREIRRKRRERDPGERGDGRMGEGGS